MNCPNEEKRMECPNCGETKKEKFGKCNAHKNGLQTYCKDCRKRYYKENTIEIAKYAQDHKDQIAARQQIYQKEYLKKNREVCNLNVKKYAQAKKERTPSNLSFTERKKMRLMKKLARELTEKTGIEHCIDHIIPLRGRKVSGLNVLANLQIVTKAYNDRKRNIYDPVRFDEQAA